MAVLDDYHAVASKEIHLLLERLVPALSPALHFILVTRRDPLLPLGHWRAQGWLMELRGRTLRFSVEEVRSFFASGNAVSLSESTVEALARKAEGSRWHSRCPSSQAFVPRGEGLPRGFRQPLPEPASV